MKNVDIRQIALFCDLLETQSLTEAARRMSVTPSAASQALSRLREILDDPLYVRENGQFQATPYAKGVLDSLREMVELWREVSTGATAFDPAHCADHIVMSCYDSFGATELVEFYRAISAAAPRLSLDIHSPENGPQDIKDLREGGVDVVCSHFEPASDAKDVHMEVLNRLALTRCCMRRDHPRIADELSLAQYLAEEHVLITFLKRNTTKRSPIDIELERLGHPPRRTSVVSSWNLCSDLLARTDRLVTTSAMQAQLLTRANPQIKSVALPSGFAWPTIAVNMIWHHRTHNSKPHRWLRLQLRDFLAGHLDVARQSETDAQGQPQHAPALSSQSVPSTVR